MGMLMSVGHCNLGDPKGEPPQKRRLRQRPGEEGGPESQPEGPPWAAASGHGLQGTEKGKDLLQESQHPRHSVEGGSCPGVRCSALSPSGPLSQMEPGKWYGYETLRAGPFQL